MSDRAVVAGGGLGQGLRSGRPGWLGLAAFALAYLAGAGIAQTLAIVPESGISVWPPSGLFIATLVATRRGTWAWWIAAALVAELTANALWFHNPWWVATLLNAGNALEALAGAWMLRMFWGVSEDRARARLETVRDVLGVLLLGAVTAPVVSSSIGAGTLALEEGAPLAQAWFLWWIGDATGVLVVAPLVLLIVTAWPMRQRRVPTPRWVEAGVLTLSFAAAAGLALGGMLPYAYIIMPPLVWAAVRFEFAGAVASTVGLTILTAAMTVAELSPFIGDVESQLQRQLMMQLLLAVSAVSALVIAAVARQQRIARATLERSNEELERQVAERTAHLRESERRFQHIADTAPAIMWVTDETHFCTFLSKRWYEFTGQREEEGLGLGWTDAVHPEDRALAKSVFLEAAERREPYRMDYRLRSTDGSYQWASDIGKPRWDDEGRFLGYVGAVLDIHERKEAERQIQAAAAQLSLIADAMPALIAYVDRDQQFRFNNKAYGEWFGEDAESLVGRHVREVVGEAAYKHIRPQAEAALRGERVSYELEMPMPRGGTRHISAEYVPDIQPDGTVAGYHALIIDQTHRQQWQRTRARLAAVVESSSDAIVSKDLNGVIESWNYGAERIFGYRAEEVIGRSILILIPEELQHEEPVILERLRRGERIENFETVRRRKDGTLLDISLTISPVYDPSGRVVGVSKIARDITERNRAETRVRETEARFRLAADAAGALVYDIDLSGGQAALVHGLERLVGYLPEEVPLDRAWWHSLIHPADLPEHLAQIEEQIRAGGMYVAQYRVRHKDGRYIWVEETTQVIREPRTRLVGALVDVTERIKAEQQLRAAHDSFRRLVEQSPFGVYAVNADFRLVLVSAGAQKVFENIRPLIGRDFAEVLRLIWPEPFATEAINRFRWTLETGEAYHAPSTLERRFDTAEMEAYDWKIERIVLPDGRFGVVCHFYDLSERLRLEGALRESEEHLRRVIDNMLGYVAVLTPDGTLVEINQTALAVGGLVREDVIGRKFWDTPWWEYDEAVAGRLRDAIDRANRGEIIRYDEQVWTSGDGRLWVDFSLVPVRDEAGEIAFLIPSGVDISDRKRAEDAMRESEERFRMLADHMSQFAWTADATGWIFWYNRRWYEFTGTTLEDMQGWGWKAVHHPDYVDRVAEKFKAHVDAGEPWEDTFPLRGKDGNYRWFLSRALPIRDEDGSVRRWFGTNTDITEQREVEQALAQHKALLEERVRERTEQLRESHMRLRVSERMASLGTLSAGLGHDMGNLLVPVRVCLDSLESADLPAELRGYVSEIKVSTEYLQQLATGLRLMAIDPERTAASFATDLGSWWQDARQVMRTALPRGIALEAEFESGCVVDMAKPAVTQVVFNLVQNAGDAMRAGGGSRLKVDARLDRDSVVLSVEDDGPGMPASVRDRCLEPFFTTKTRDISTGLGLVLVAGLVKDAGGTVEIESEPGRGTRFLIRLPRAEALSGGAPAGGGRETAIVRLADKRLSAFVVSELRAVSIEVASEGQEADIAVVDGLSDADDLLQRVRYTIVLGEDGSNGNITSIGSSPRPATIRDAVRSAARQLRSSGTTTG